MVPRTRRDLISSRRRVVDEGEEESVLDPADLEEDSLSEEGSLLSDDHDGLEDDEIEGLEDGQPIHISAGTASFQKMPVVNCISQRSRKGSEAMSCQAVSGSEKSIANGTSDGGMTLNRLGLEDPEQPVEIAQCEYIAADMQVPEPSPIVVKSSAHMDQPQEAAHERRRREHDSYRKKRDEDPAFVPNRGAFFMHDHRHAGPAANGFRPSGRGRGTGRPGIGGPFAPVNQLRYLSEPTDAPWAHDMHEIISEPPPRLQQVVYSRPIDQKGPATAPSSTPPNRSLSTTRHIGNAQIRIFFSTMDKPLVFSGIQVKQYTRLPDHRPPLRRDKPVRISLPDRPPRYIFPAAERSFIFIPRAMRPNQHGIGSRGRGRSGIGSFGGYSRRTSVFGGSMYGSVYSPSVSMSRRSSLAREVNRDAIVSPVGSVVSRPPMAMDISKPVVRLPPTNPSSQLEHPQASITLPNIAQASSTDKPLRLQTYPLPQKPTFRENRPTAIPMHQPRPQKAVSVADIESPATLSINAPQQQQQQPFHQQVPLQINGSTFVNDPSLHIRHNSYPSQASAGTPLSQIPERAIHAQPFHPATYQQPAYYLSSYAVMQPTQQDLYYPPRTYSNPPISAPAAANGPIVSGQQMDVTPTSAGSVQNLIAQEANGMVYYYDASQVATFQSYPQAPPYPMTQLGGVVGMGGMMTPTPDGFYYPQPPHGVVYYPQ